MSVRSILRGVVYRLLRHPDSEVTLTARCMSGDGCGWELEATGDLGAGGVAIMSHTARTGHAIFTRRLEDMACVVLASLQEQDRRVAVNRLERAVGPCEADIGTEHARAET
ncbi:hypothetical protein [Streptomyces sp. BPTC-684]|uniref:hypothetical protein n=1 Tax=Streptomyces sp. BPTC-684 TaxID=3043734 RepID=UPI0024B234DD|nr:hypothetical protein [Streptomyces sp. BPTC-684]WHM37441.1 hypothetical protein QIY60_11345 [Streptomyces sp. BPTC-684]